MNGWTNKATFKMSLIILNNEMLMYELHAEIVNGFSLLNAFEKLLPNLSNDIKTMIANDVGFSESVNFAEIEDAILEAMED